jgi:uncharacterized membrane protein
MIIFILGVCGFMVAKHIRDHKTKNRPLVCMAGFDCHAVVHSDYSKFLGAPVELLGMAYYAFITLAYLLFTLAAMPAGFAWFLAMVSLASFLFSVYLISVQIFVLRKGCSWCLVSALISTLIFVLVLFG